MRRDCSGLLRYQRGASSPGSVSTDRMSAGTVAASGVVAAVPSTDLEVNDLASAPSSTKLSLAITLRYRNEGRLDDLITNQTDPSSGQFTPLAVERRI